MSEELLPRVHVLFQDKPLCKFSEKRPLFWPRGHTWIAPLHAEKASIEEILSWGRKLSCPECCEALRHQVRSGVWPLLPASHAAGR